MSVETPPPKPVVVAIDGSDESVAALAWAAGRAAGAGERLRVVTSYQHPFPPTEVAGEYWRELLAAKRSARLRAEAAIADVLGHTDVDHVLHLGPVERVLVGMSRQASLLVVGSRPSTTWWSRLRGSIADRIKDAAVCPVVSVPIESSVAPQPVAA